MTKAMRTRFATLFRKKNLGLLTDDSEIYHAFCKLIMEMK